MFWPELQSAPAASGIAAGGAKRIMGAKFVQAMRTAQRDFLDVALYFVIGVAIASILKTQVFYRPSLQEGMSVVAGNHWIALPVLMVMAFVLSLCSTTDAFIIAADNLFPAVAKLAFLVFGPMLDLKLIFLYSTVLKPRAVALLGGVSFHCRLCGRLWHGSALAVAAIPTLV